MLGVDGSIEIAIQSRDIIHAEVDLVVRELDRYDVIVAGLQETKWMGSAVFDVRESVLLTAGRPP